MTSAISLLKSGEELLEHPDRLSQNLRNVLVDKGITPLILEKWLQKQGNTHNLERLIGHFLMRMPYEASSQVLQQSIKASLHYESHFTYRGLPNENKEVDESIADSGDRTGYRDRIGRGAARYFSLMGYTLPSFSRNLKRIPIAVLGAGAASILITRTLINAGFHNVTVIADQDIYGGLWNQKNVREASKNNPFPFVYEDVQVGAAPGLGKHISHFLEDLATPQRGYGWKPLPTIHNAKITAIKPGNLTHTISYRDASGEHSLQVPIVINCLGIGRPLAPSREGIMTTDTPEHAGIRWQQVISYKQAQKLQGKTLVFLGLGNSTAEMLIQLQRYRAAGFNIRYKVITHYPDEATHYPNHHEFHHEKLYRLYRNINAFQLTKLAGDLPDINTAFRQLRNSDNPEQEELITQVTHWHVETSNVSRRKIMHLTLENNDTRSFDFDQMYTLIGYGHSQTDLEAMGMTVLDTYSGTIATDYDGEIQRQLGACGRDRIYAGYFGFGSILKSAAKPNAQVVPGMLYGLPDLFATVALRSAEHVFHLKSR